MVTSFISFLTAPTSVLILLMVGYELSFSHELLKPVLQTVALRFILMAALMPLFPLDDFVPAPLAVMEAPHGMFPEDKAPIWQAFQKAADIDMPGARFEMMEHDAFMERAYAVAQTGETALYGNIILRKGVVRLQGPMAGLSRKACCPPVSLHASRNARSGWKRAFETFPQPSLGRVRRAGVLPRLPRVFSTLNFHGG